MLRKHGRDAPAQPSYLDIIRRYPLPTAEQTRNFAEYVAHAHSWYKHLPVYPPVPFVFYLDPNAGRATLMSKSGKLGFEDIVDESSRFHYTWQLTETYRSRLGYWNYFAPYGTYFLVPHGRAVIDTRQSGQAEGGPAIFVPKSGWITVPEALVLAGTVGVTALVHKWRNFGAYWAVETEGNAPERVRISEFVERHADVLPTDARTGLLKWAACRRQQSGEGDDRRLAVAREPSCEQSEVFPLLDRERNRQIASMEAAMQRFLTLL